MLTGRFKEYSATFHQGKMQQDGGFSALGTTKKEALQALEAAADDAIIRKLLAREIIVALRAGKLHEIFTSECPKLYLPISEKLEHISANATKLLKKVKNPPHNLDEKMGLKLTNILSYLKSKAPLPPEAKEAEDLIAQNQEIENFCQKEEVYSTYVTKYMLQDDYRLREKGGVDALAYRFKFRLLIYRAKYNGAAPTAVAHLEPQLVFERITKRYLNTINLQYIAYVCSEPDTPDYYELTPDAGVMVELAKLADKDPVEQVVHNPTLPPPLLPSVEAKLETKETKKDIELWKNLHKQALFCIETQTLDTTEYDFCTSRLKGLLTNSHGSDDRIYKLMELYFRSKDFAAILDIFTQFPNLKVTKMETSMLFENISNLELKQATAEIIMWTCCLLHNFTKARAVLAKMSTDFAATIGSCLSIYKQFDRTPGWTPYILPSRTSLPQLFPSSIPRLPRAEQPTLSSPATSSAAVQASNKRPLEQYAGQPPKDKQSRLNKPRPAALYLPTGTTTTFHSTANPISQTSDLDSLFEVVNEWDRHLAIAASSSSMKTGLMAEAKKWNFNCEEVQNIDNCFLHAVFHQLVMRKIRTDITPGKLRLLVIDHFLKNKHYYESLTESWAKFIAAMLTNKEWANNQIILALSRALDVTIVIIQSNAEPPVVIKRVNPTAAVIYIGYEAGCYYQSLEVSDPSAAAMQPIINVINRATPDQYEAVQLVDEAKATSMIRR